MLRGKEKSKAYKNNIQSCLSLIRSEKMIQMSLLTKQKETDFKNKCIVIKEETLWGDKLGV